MYKVGNDTMITKLSFNKVIFQVIFETNREQNRNHQDFKSKTSLQMGSKKNIFRSTPAGVYEKKKPTIIVLDQYITK